MSDVKTWRHYLPSIDGEGWAVIFFSSDGAFSAVSDYGNYGHFWSHHGRDDFRRVLAAADRDPDYFIGKLSHGKEYDDDATYKAIMEEIAEREADGRLTKEGAESERELLEEHDDVYASEDLSLWYAETTMEDLDMGEIRCLTHPASVRAFCTKTLPRLAAILRAELEAERKAT